MTGTSSGRIQRLPRSAAGNFLRILGVLEFNLFDRDNGTVQGRAGNYGEDYGIAWELGSVSRPQWRNRKHPVG